MKRVKKFLMGGVPVVALFGLVACGEVTLPESSVKRSVATHTIQDTASLAVRIPGCDVKSNYHYKSNTLAGKQLMYEEWESFSSGDVTADSLSSEMVDAAYTYNRNNEGKRWAPFLNRSELRQRAWNRSFSLGVLNVCKYGPKLLTYEYGGTGRTVWLLDYAHDRQSNRYKLFFGTSLQAANEIYYNSAFSPDNYSYGASDRKQVNANVFLGKNIEISPTGEVHSVYFSPEGVTRKISNVRKVDVGNVELWTQVMSRPKIVFAAVDFMYSEATRGVNFSWIKGFSRIRWHFNKGQENKEMPIFPYDYTVPEYKDFAVLELDFDAGRIDALAKTLDKEGQDYWDLTLFKKLIMIAIKEVDRAQEEQKQLNFSNKNNHSDNWWDAADNASSTTFAALNADFRPLKGTYFAGYNMQDFDDRVTLRTEKLIDRTSETEADTGLDYGDEVKEQAIADSRLAFVSSWHSGVDFRNTYFHKYGFTNHLVQRNAPKISGALVFNTQGLPVGVSNGRLVIWDYEKGKPEWFETYDEFSQVIPINTTRTAWSSHGREPFEYVTYPFNLIDGTDSSRFPLQKHSYRSALFALYPHGVFDNGDTSTALFEDYRITR